MALFGFNLGFNKGKQKGTSDTASTKSEQETGSQSESTAGTTTTTGLTSQSGTSASQGTTAQTDSRTQTGTTSGVSRETGTQNSLDQRFVDETQAILSSILGDSFAGNKSKIDGLAGKLGGFDIDSFVEDQVAGAGQDVVADSGRLLRSLESEGGGTAGTNTTAALLGNRIQRDTANNLAGIRASAVKVGNEIQQGNVATATGALTSNQGLIPSLINALKGGNVAASSVADTSEQQATNSTGTGTTDVRESGQNSSTTANSQEQIVSQIVNSLLSKLTGTSLTESVKTTGKSSGFTGGLKIG